jgi:hypothetical protein
VISTTANPAILAGLISSVLLAVFAFIRWDFFPVWAIIGLALEPIHDLLVRLTPAIEAALK